MKSPDYTNGVMVALYPHPDVAKELALEAGGAEAPELLHVTLAFIGERGQEEVPDKDHWAELHDGAKEVAKRHQEQEAQVTGLAQFAPGDNGTPYVGIIGCHTIHDLQSDLVNTLKGKGIPVSDKYPFVPHMTFGYMEDGEEAPNHIEVPQDLTFDKLVVKNGQVTHEFPLQPKPKVEKEASLEDDHVPNYEYKGNVAEIAYHVASCSCGWETNVRSENAAHNAWQRHFNSLDEGTRREQAGPATPERFENPKPTKRWGAWLDQVTAPYQQDAVAEPKDGIEPVLPPLYQENYGVWPDDKIEEQRRTVKPVDIFTRPVTGSIPVCDLHVSKAYFDLPVGTTKVSSGISKRTICSYCTNEATRRVQSHEHKFPHVHDPEEEESVFQEAENTAYELPKSEHPTYDCESCGMRGGLQAPSGPLGHTQTWTCVNCGHSHTWSIPDESHFANVTRTCMRCHKVFDESEDGEHTGFCQSCREDEGMVTHHSWSEDAQEGHYGKWEPPLSAETQPLIEEIRKKHYENQDPQTYPAFHDHLLRCGPIAEDIERQLGHEAESGLYIGPEIKTDSSIDRDDPLDWVESGFGYDHMWNRTDDGAIIDAASDQFGGGTGVRYIPKDDPRQRHYMAYDEYEDTYRIGPKESSTGKTNKAYVAIGIPGSGKSTILEPYAASIGATYVSSDATRGEVTGDPADVSKDAIVWPLVYQRVHEALDKGDVVVDATHANGNKRREMIAHLRQKAAEVHGIYFDVPLDTAMERNENRDRRVPPEIIASMHKQLQDDPPSEDDGFDSITRLHDREITASKNGIPDAPGTTPIPEGHVRIYHATWANPEEIRSGGLLMQRARDSYERGGTEFPAIFGYAGYHDALDTQKSGEGANVVEFHLPLDDLDIGRGSTPEDLEAARRSTVTTMKDVAPENIIAVHEPWHAVYRHIKEDPRIVDAVMAGEHDWAMEKPGYGLGEAVRRIKAEGRKAQLTTPVLERLTEDARPEEVGGKGGFSLSIRNTEPSSGYMVSQAGTERRHPFEIESPHLAVPHLRGFVRTNEGLLAPDHMYFGGWLDSEKRLCLDVSENYECAHDHEGRLCDDRKRAYIAGIEHRQEMIYHVNGHENDKYLDPRTDGPEDFPELEEFVAKYDRERKAAREASESAKKHFFRVSSDASDDELLEIINKIVGQ